MKIDLSMSEAITILTGHFEDKFPNESITVTIGERVHPAKLKIITTIKTMLTDNSKTNNKVSAIKYLRSASGLGLAECKTIVDQIIAGADDDDLYFEPVG